MLLRRRGTTPVPSRFPQVATAYSRRELIADGCIHAVGVCSSILAVAVMLTAAWMRQPLSTTICLLIYGAAMVAMFSFSAAYNLLPTEAWKDRLRRCDQAAIFVKIAATYTPFAAIKMGGALGYSLLALVWSVAVVGAGAKLILGSQGEKLSIALYLALGWSGLLFIRPLVESIPHEALIFLGLGGATYTLGVLFHIWERLPYQNAIWHLFVLTGTCLHFAAVLGAVLVA